MLDNLPDIKLMVLKVLWFLFIPQRLFGLGHLFVAPHQIIPVSSATQKLKSLHV